MSFFVSFPESNVVSMALNITLLINMNTSLKSFSKSWSGLGALNFLCNSQIASPTCSNSNWTVESRVNGLSPSSTISYSRSSISLKIQVRTLLCRWSLSLDHFSSSPFNSGRVFDWKGSGQFLSWFDSAIYSLSYISEWIFSLAVPSISSLFGALAVRPVLTVHSSHLKYLIPALRSFSSYLNR